MLTEFVQDTEVRGIIRELYPRPPLGPAPPLVAPPLTQNFGNIGTAYDYLVRFHLERLNPAAASKDWVASKSIMRLPGAILQRRVRPYAAQPGDTTQQVLDGWAQTIPAPMMRICQPHIAAAWEMLQRARTAHEAYLGTGTLTRALIGATLDLAQLDAIYRAGRFFGAFQPPSPLDVKDLQQLILVTPANILRKYDRVELNPIFPGASGLVGGADVDLIADDVLLELKSSKNWEWDPKHWGQLVGYLVLADISHDSGNMRRPKEFGIYFARYAALKTWPAAMIYDHAGYASFRKKFVARAEVLFGPRIDFGIAKPQPIPRPQAAPAKKIGKSKADQPVGRRPTPRSERT